MIDAEAFRTTMRQLASGVVVLTTTLEGRLHATTATAFLPLSVDPPLVLVCIHRDSSTHRALTAAGRFGVNILAMEQEHLSRRFASKTSERHRLDDLALFSGPRGAVFFSHCAASIEVEMSDTAAGGDHTIFIGRVVWSQVDSKRKPLVHYQSGYHRLTPLIEAADVIETRKRA